MARHAYDTLVLPPFDADLGAAVLHRLRTMFAVSGVVVAAEVVVAFATSLLGPPTVPWMAIAGGKGGGGVLWDVLVPSGRLPVLVLWLTVPALALAGAPAARVARLIRERRPHRGVPRWTVVGLALVHAVAPSLTLATIGAWAGWGAAGATAAALLPQFGTSAVVGLLIWRRHQLNPFLWADPWSRGGRLARERWARRSRGTAGSGGVATNPAPAQR